MAERRQRVRRGGRKPAPSATPKHDLIVTDDDELAVRLPSPLTRAYVEHRLHDKALQQAGLEPVPDFDGDMPELPQDIAATSHDELSQLMVDFQNALATATWQASMQYIEADAMEEIADYLEDNAILHSDQSNDAKRKAEARTSEDVVAFRSKQRHAYRNYVRFRDLARSIEGKVKVLSRVGGFALAENEASDRSARPKMRRKQ